MKQFLAAMPRRPEGDERPPADELQGRRYGFYAAGILEQLAETLRRHDRGRIIWVGKPRM